MIEFKIGKVTIRKKGVFAPLLEFSTLPYRLLAKEHNAGLCYTEMIHTNHLVNLSQEQFLDEEILKSTKDDSPTSCQLVGDFTDRKTTLLASEIIDKSKFFDIIDLNMGCPSIRIIHGRSGSSLLKDVTKVIPTIKELCETTKKPITIKTRLGFSKNEITFISNELFKTGISALAIHGRTAKESYASPSKVDEVRRIRELSPIPIIYNGDVSEENYKDYLDFQGVMVGRGAIGNPGIFDLIYGNKEKITREDKLSALQEYLKLWEKNPTSFAKLKVSIIPFIRGAPKSSVLRDKISKSKSLDEIKSILPKE